MKLVNPVLDFFKITRLKKQPSVGKMAVGPKVRVVTLTHGEKGARDMKIGYIRVSGDNPADATELKNGTIQFILVKENGQWSRSPHKVEAKTLFDEVGQDNIRLFVGKNDNRGVLDFDGSAEASKALEIHRMVSNLSQGRGLRKLEFIVGDKQNVYVTAAELFDTEDQATDIRKTTQVVAGRMKEFVGAEVSFDMFGTARYTIKGKTFEFLSVAR